MSFFNFAIPARLLPHYRAGLLALALILFFLVNLQGIGGGFFGDDGFYLINNHALQSLGFTELWKLFPDSARFNGLDWGPLRDLFYKAVLSLYGVEPLPFKILNYFLYASAAASAYCAADALMKLFGGPVCAGIADVPLMAAVLFALHPTHIESLQAIWGAKDLLMAAFGLAAFPPYVRWLQARRWESAAFSAVLLACAGLSKGASVSLLAPMWLMAYASCERGSVARKLVEASLRLLPVAILPLAVFLAFQLASPLQQFYDLDVSNWTDRPLIILGGQSLIALVPWPLSLAYAPYGELMPLYLGVGAAVLGVGAFCAWSFLRRPALVTFGALFFVTMMLPYLQLMPFATGSMIADRFGFTGIFGLGLAAATLLARIAAPYRWIVVAVLLMTYLLLGGLRANGWGDLNALLRSDGLRTQAETSKSDYVTIMRNVGTVRGIRMQVKEQGARMSRAQADAVLACLAEIQEALAKPRVKTADIAALWFYIRAENDVAGVYYEVYKQYGAHPSLGADASGHFLRNGRLQQAMQWAEFAASTPGVPPQKLALAYRNYGNAAAASGNLRAGAGALYQSMKIEPNPAAACAIVELQRLHPGEVYLADGVAKLCQSR